MRSAATVGICKTHHLTPAPPISPLFPYAALFRSVGRVLAANMFAPIVSAILMESVGPDALHEDRAHDGGEHVGREHAPDRSEERRVGEEWRDRRGWC